VTALDDADWVAISSMVLKKEVAEKMDRLTELGAKDILVLGMINSRTD
jgi:ATP phosphoribosyltransferase-like protein